MLKQDGNGCKHSKFLRSKRKLLWSKKQSQKVTREPQETESTLKVNVYKNYIPLCAVLVVGIGIYMSYDKPVPIQAKQVTQPTPQQSTPDPFEMN